MEPGHPVVDVVYPTPAAARAWIAKGAWLAESVGDVIQRAARERGSATAIVDGDRRLDYAALERRTAAVAGGLLAAGLEPGDRVTVQVGITADAAVVLLGLMRAGLVPVCAVPHYRAYEMSALAGLSEARAHVVEPGAAGSFDLVELGNELRAAQPTLEHLFVAGGDGGHGAPAVDALAESVGAGQLPRPTPVDVAAFQLSGGTTDVPKIIPRFHAEYLGYANAWADRLELAADDVLLWSLPIAHNAGMLCFLLPTLIRQATLVLLRRFDADAFLETIERERVTVTGSIGPIAPRLLDVVEPERYRLASVRAFVTLNRAADIERHLGTPAMNIFGITEGMLAASAPGAPPAARHATVGSPASPHDRVRVLAAGAERDLQEGEIGELCFRGPSTLIAYYRNPEATAAAFTSDGYFRTGDLVQLHHIEGIRHFSFEGRLKDNIDRGGEKFGTEPIEILLAEHPAIREARVVGMPDEYLGERVCAFVIPTGAAAPSVEEVGEFLTARGLAKFKLPERIEPVDEMPVTAVGKLDRQGLRRRIAEMLAAEAAAR
jgi:pyochelin biosynthesis protein PchD